MKGSSALQPVDFGVVQGSILGPILFNIFTNDLHCHISEQCKVVSYADDTVILHSAPPSEEGLVALKNNVEGDLVNLAAWFTNNGLKANPRKTEMSLFGTPAVIKKTGSFKVQFDDVLLSPAEQIKILGVLLDRHLTMEKQTAGVVKRCFSILITMRKLNCTLPKSTLKTLVQSLVFPHLTYCLPAWAPPTNSLRQRIDKVINFATRVVTKKRKFDHITESKELLGWLPFEKVIKERDCLLIHRLMSREDAPENLKSLVEHRADVSERDTRASVSSALHTRRCRLEATRRSVMQRPILAWNGLPADLRQNVGDRDFKNLVRVVLAAP